MLTRIKSQVFVKVESSETWPRYLKIEEHKDSDNKFNEKLAIVFYKYRDILDASYRLLLSESRDLERLNLIRSRLPRDEPLHVIPDVKEAPRFRIC